MEEGASLIKDLLPHYNYVICKDCWNDLLLKNILTKHTAFIGNERYLVIVFESGQLTCQKEDLKGRSGIVKSSGVVQEEEDSKFITFPQNENLDNDGEFKVAFEKLKISIPDFDGLMDLVKIEISSGADSTLNEEFEVEKIENGVRYIIPKRNIKR